MVNRGNDTLINPGRQNQAGEYQNHDQHQHAVRYHRFHLGNHAADGRDNKSCSFLSIRKREIQLLHQRLQIAADIDSHILIRFLHLIIREAAQQFFLILIRILSYIDIILVFPHYQEGIPGLQIQVHGIQIGGVLEGVRIALRLRLHPGISVLGNPAQHGRRIGQGLIAGIFHAVELLDRVHLVAADAEEGQRGEHTRRQY